MPADDDPPDPFALMSAITEQHLRSQRAFMKLLAAGPDLQARREAHREYREATGSLLDLQLQHNRQLQERPSLLHPWDIETLARPLVQQTMIEADLAEASGETDEAERLREMAMQLADGHLSPGPRAQERRGRAAVLASQGRFNDALIALDDIKKVFVDLGDDLQLAQTALEMAVILEWLGDQRRALDAIREAEARVRPRLAGRVPGSRDIVGALAKEAASIFSGKGTTGEAGEAAALWRISAELEEHEARVRKALGEYDDAERLFEKVLRDTYGQLCPAGAAIEYQLAAIDTLRGRYAVSKKRLSRIAPEFERGQLRPRRPALRIAQIDVELGLEPASSAALDLARDGLDDLEKYPDFDQAWKLHWRRGRALQGLGRPDDALSSYAEAAGIVDSLRKTPLGYRLDSTYLLSKLPLFESAIDLAEARGAGAACARFIELIKARALSNVISIPPGRRTGRTALELDFDRVTQRLDAIEYTTYRNAGTRALSDEHDELVARRQSLIEQIRLRDPRWRGLTAPAQFEPESFASRLGKQRRAALTLFVRPDRTVAVLLSRGEILVASQKLEAPVRRALQDYTKNLQKWQPDVYAHDFSVRYHITADMLAPHALLQRALEADSLFIAPHGALHLLPWPALLLDGERLFEHTAVAVLPNVTCLDSLDREFSAAPKVALIGAPDYRDLPRLDDLPDAGAELEDLQKLYAGMGRLLAPPATGPAATEETLRRTAEREDADGSILHVACHGTLDNVEPMSSGLLLSDSKLDAGELAMMQIRYEEVVLSACSTGWRPEAVGDVQLTGDDVLGLPGAVLEAGARAVVVSIPKADDAATRAFMTAYHSRRASGQTPLRAFRQTQLDLLQQKSPVRGWAGIACYSAR